MAHPQLIPLAEDLGIPASWYTIALSAELKPGTMLPFTLAGISLLAYRTASGTACVVEDRCPHLGGSFSKGSVVGNHIRCPVHGFAFDTVGTCVETGFSEVSSKACINQWPVLDSNGLVMVFYHPQGQAPAWQPEAVDWQGWSAQIMQTATFPATVQLVMEGIADKGHLSTVHGYSDVRMDKEFIIDGPKLTTAYSFTNSGSLPGAGKLMQWLSGFFDTRLRVEFDYDAWGLGYSLTLVRIPKFNIEMRNIVNPTPVDGATVKLFYSMAIGPIKDAGEIHPLMKLLPISLVRKIMMNSLLKGFSHDLDDDIAMWSAMKALERPQLCQADGPFNKFRKWAGQFYL